MITIKDLFRDIDGVISIKGENKLINSLTSDSRLAAPGCLFFALVGSRYDSNNFINIAIEKGAVGIVSEYDLELQNTSIAIIHLQSIKRVLSVVAKKFYGDLDTFLKLIGITGTSGKTTVASLIHFLLKNVIPSALLGNLGFKLKETFQPMSLALPESIELNKLLKYSYENGIQCFILEANSHGIHQDRIHGLNFDTTVFLNLSPEHLDYHVTMESYFKCKQSFFMNTNKLYPQTIIIGIDDAYGQRLLTEISKDCKSHIKTFGLSEQANVRAKNISSTLECTTFDLIIDSIFQGTIQVPMCGIFNVQNILAAICTVLKYRSDIPTMIQELANFPGVEGRFQRLQISKPFEVIIDNAHKQDALYQMVSTLKQLCTSRLLVVFGCGGERDRTKRAPMTAYVQEYANFTWATADNPRRESQESIFEDMKIGILYPETITFINDRREAIKQALQYAQCGDILLIAGRGGEHYQLIGDQQVIFDDAQVVKELLEN